jgi:hypothetical protein
VGYKKVLLSAIIICLTLLPVSVQGWAVQESFQELVSIEQVLDFVGCNREYLNASGWCMLNKDYMSLSDLKSLARKAADFFDLKQSYDFFSSQGNGIRQVSIRGVNKGGQVISIVCQSIQTLADKNQGYESYIAVDIVDSTHKVNSRAVKALLKEFFDTIGMNPTITVTLVGSFKGRLEPSDMQSICSSLFGCLRARVVEGLHEGGLMSISGYSPALGKGIVSGGRPVNLQVALRYNSYKGRTYIWVGTPIISIEY